MQKNLSKKAYAEASQYIPGGVNSPVRALKSVGADPLFVRKAQDAHFIDIDGNDYIDFCLSWGVFLLGHNHSGVNATVKLAIDQGTSYGIPTLQETQLAKLVTELVSAVEKLRFVSSGTEAVMSAIRLARGYTKRNLIVKFDGCYHGHADHLLVSAGSGVAQLSEASSDGVPKAFTQYTLSLPYNDIETFRQLMQTHGKEVAAVIVEPIAANMGVVLPHQEFIHSLRQFTKEAGALLIFDEVITGFRLGLGGAQALLGIQPDLSTFGKVIGGGFPAAAFGGKAEIMDLLSPIGSVYQAGTLSGNPIAMTAGLQTLKLLQTPGFYTDLQEKSDWFFTRLEQLIDGKSICLNHIGSMFTFFFSEHEVRNFEDVKNSDTEAFARFYRQLLNEGIYFSPSPFETNFISAAHTPKDLENTLNALKKIWS